MSTQAQTFFYFFFFNEELWKRFCVYNILSVCEINVRMSFFGVTPKKLFFNISLCAKIQKHRVRLAEKTPKKTRERKTSALIYIYICN